MAQRGIPPSIQEGRLRKEESVKTHTFTKLGVQCDGKFEDVAYLRARPL